jgi:hypothetical protein
MKSNLHQKIVLLIAFICFGAQYSANAQLSSTTYEINITACGPWDEGTVEIRNALNAVVFSATGAGTFVYTSNGAGANVGPFTFFAETQGIYNDNCAAWTITSPSCGTINTGNIVGGQTFTSAAFLCAVTGPTSKIRTNQCGTTLALLKSNIKADLVLGCEAYRFEVTYGLSVRTFETFKSNFNLTEILGTTYGTTYGIKVAVKMAGVWGNYGVSCNVTTPSIIDASSVPTTSLRTSNCGATLAALGSPIHADLIYGARNYRFEVTNGASVRTFVSPNYYFFLTKMLGSTYATTYSIKAAVNIAGTWGNYGAACLVTTPILMPSTIPVTQLRPTYCGTVLTALNTKIPASTVYLAEAYRFEITAGGTTTVYDSSFYLFRLANAGVVVANNTTYSIRVAAKINGVYGNYGVSCNVTTPNASSRQMVDEQSEEFNDITEADSDKKSFKELDKTIVYNLLAFPNPSNSAFKLQVIGATSENISVLIFDLMGRQVENKVFAATDLEHITIGQNYAAGIYNVIVSQGTKTETIRLVKN